MIRRLLERLHLIDPPDEAVEQVRRDATDVNAEARDEVHASREKRTVILLNDELSRRRRLSNELELYRRGKP